MIPRLALHAARPGDRSTGHCGDGTKVDGGGEGKRVASDASFGGVESTRAGEGSCRVGVTTARPSERQVPLLEGDAAHSTNAPCCGMSATAKARDSSATARARDWSAGAQARD